MAGVLLGLAACGAGAVARWSRPMGPADVAGRFAGAAREFLAALRPELRERAALPFDHAARTDWQIVPRDRAGVWIREMSDGERRAAHGLLRAALSAGGYLKAHEIMQLDAVLREMAQAAGRDGSFRDPERYAFAVFGEPGSPAWGWRVEGHHLSLNFTVADGVAVTPSFLGANPAEVRTGAHAGLRVLGEEEDLGRALLAALSDEQRGRVIIAPNAPPDVIFGPGRERGALGEARGVAVAEMTEAQRHLVWRLIEEYAHALEHDLAHEQLERVRAAGADAIRFAWAGSAEPGEPHYYRLHGPTFVIEYDNTQDGANHVHTVWRDFEHDFGDALLRHYREHHPPTPADPPR